MSFTVADLIIETLKGAGIQRVYGIPGDSLNGFTDAIRRDGMLAWQHVRHEEAAAFAAAGEATLTGELAVCAASCGPGNLHLINGLYDAHRSASTHTCYCRAHSFQRDRGLLLSRDTPSGAISRMQHLLRTRRFAGTASLRSRYCCSLRYRAKGRSRLGDPRRCPPCGGRASQHGDDDPPYAIDGSSERPRTRCSRQRAQLCSSSDHSRRSRLRRGA